MRNDTPESPEPVAHHPAILLVLQRVPQAEARMLRSYMDLLLQAVETFSVRGKALRAERDALLEVLKSLIELSEMVATPAGPPASPATATEAQRQTDALLATVRQKASGNPHPKGEG